MMSLEGGAFDCADRNSLSSFTADRRSSVDTGASSAETVLLPAGASPPSNQYFPNSFKSDSPSKWVVGVL